MPSTSTDISPTHSPGVSTAIGLSENDGVARTLRRPEITMYTFSLIFSGDRSFSPCFRVTSFALRNSDSSVSRGTPLKSSADSIKRNISRSEEHTSELQSQFHL